MEFNDEPFLSQLASLMHASILVAVHGAGCANIVWLPPGRGALVELAHNAGGNHHYQQMATWLGHDYRCAGTPLLRGYSPRARPRAPPALPSPCLCAKLCCGADFRARALPSAGNPPKLTTNRRAVDSYADAVDADAVVKALRGAMDRLAAGDPA
jgi:hypothetical protein